MNFYEDTNPVQTLDDSSIISKTFFRMFLGLLASAVAAIYAYYSGAYIPMILNGTYITLAIAEVVVVLVFSLLFRKLSATVVTILFFAYAFLNGFTLSVIFAVYEIGSIATCFIATAGLFGILAYLGYKTDKDISNWRTILTVCLIVGVILSIINLFMHSSMLSIILDWGILFVFFGLTVYDMNKIKQMRDMGICEDDKLYVYGAMELYLDFINIFLRILSLFGKRKN